MSVKADRKDFANSTQDLSVTDVDQEERLTSPAAARGMHSQHVHDDADASFNRAAVQELKDFVPPYDPADLAKRRMSDRFNVNFGLVASYINEAVGAYHDLFTSPPALVKIILEPDVDPDKKDSWAAIMSEEWTKMFRSWDGAPAKMLALADVFVTHGVVIPWFKDKASMVFDVFSMEECKFPPDTVAIPSQVEFMTLELKVSLPELYSKIGKAKPSPKPKYSIPPSNGLDSDESEASEGYSDDDQETEKSEGESEGESEYNDDGWNEEVVKWLITTSVPQSTTPNYNNYEAVARQIKAARLSCNTALPSVTLIWCFVKELDGSISVYATTKDLRGAGTKEGLQIPNENIDPMNECWTYRKVSAFEDANQMFQIFAFSAGQKNRIHTIRGMGYALYEAGQADNILRCKMMDAARHRASEIYETEVPINDIDDIQFIDVGHAMIMPKGLKGVPQSGLGRLDQSLGFALQSMGEVMDRHGMGLANNSVADNPNARRNEMQVTVEVEHLNKMQSFAISLFYNPYDNLIRELVRRAFTETQKDNTARRLVEAMKDACEVRGVPRGVFGQINFPATQATRLVGAGSKGSRMIGFQQLAQMYSSMDEQGQEFFNYDIASEIKGADAAERYFGLPGEDRGHVDIGIARSENNDMLEGTIMEVLKGENHMVHLHEHLEELVAGIQQVNEGSVDLADWTMRHIPLYKHATETLQATSVHPSRMPEFNSYRQQLQQVGEIIDNGMRHINKLREEGQLPGQPGAPGAPGGQAQPGQSAQPGQAPVGPDGQPVDPKAAQEASAAQKDNDIKNAKMVGEAQAKIQMMAVTSKAKIDISRQESIAKINALDAETAAKIRRQTILDKAGAGGG